MEHVDDHASGTGGPDGGIERSGRGGASWSDVALAIVDFAREDTEKFVVVVVVLAPVIWFLFPGVTAMMRGRYRLARSRGRREASAGKDREDD